VYYYVVSAHLEMDIMWHQEQGHLEDVAQVHSESQVCLLIPRRRSHSNKLPLWLWSSDVLLLAGVIKCARVVQLADSSEIGEQCQPTLNNLLLLGNF
jgi:hypothetical protein